VDDEFIRQLESDYCMEKPEFMPEEVGQMMADYWKPEPHHQRPTFNRITAKMLKHC